MQLRRWIGYSGTALRVAFIRPIWGLDKVHGPLAAGLTILAGLFVGYLTKNPAWGLVILLAALLCLAFVAVLTAVASDDQTAPLTRVSPEHRDALKAIATKFRRLGPEEDGVDEQSDDWRALEGHFGEVADQLRQYNLNLSDVEQRQRELRSHIGGMVDESPVKADRRTMAYESVAKTIERLVAVPGGLVVPITFQWHDANGLTQVGTNVYPNDLWGVVTLGDPDTGAIRLAVEQMTNDAKSSDEALAVVQATQVLHDSENEAAQSLDRITRRDTIVGTCPDCAV